MKTAEEYQHLFDCNCIIGRRSLRSLQEFYTVEKLIKEMAYFGISRALVYHAVAEEYSPLIGNSQLLEEIRDKKPLEGCWVGLASQTEEVPDPKQMIEEALNKGIKAFKIFPVKHHFLLEEWSCGKFLSTLNDHKMLLFLDLDQTTWKEVYHICKHYPRLPLVLTNVNYYIDRLLYPLCEMFGQLHIEISHYYVFRGIETICKRFGAHHLLFGTRLPIFEGGSAKTMVVYAQISREEKQLIFGENLNRLLGEVE